MLPDVVETSADIGEDSRRSDEAKPGAVVRLFDEQPTMPEQPDEGVGSAVRSWVPRSSSRCYPFTMQAAEDAALRLSAERRLRLIERLWESMVDDCGDQLPVTPEIRDEVERRLLAHQRAPHETLSWAEIQRLVREGE